MDTLTLLGSFLIDLAIVALLFVLVYIVWQFSKGVKYRAELDETYSIIEILNLKTFASKKGLDIDKERLRTELLKRKSKSFQSRLEGEIINDFFGKEDKTKIGGK